MAKIAIHQPNFFPYMGFFQKLDQSDLMVILGNCQYEKHNYQNRFNYKDRWHTMSVNKGLEPIADKRYVNYDKDWQKIKTNIGINNLDYFDGYINDSLLATNVNIIKALARILGITTPIVYDYPTDKTGTARLVDILRKHKAKTYLSGISGKNYLELERFDIWRIKVEYQDNIDTRPVIDLIK